jgi:type I restriction enzyme M protein
MSKISLSMLETFLEEQCDILRTNLDASEYKDYLISLIFLKWRNDTFSKDYEKWLEYLKSTYPDLAKPENVSALENEADRANFEAYEFYIPVLARWNVKRLPGDFVFEQNDKITQAERILADKKTDKTEKAQAEKDRKEAEDNLHWQGILNVKENLGDALTRALKQLEDSNEQILQGILSTTKFNTLNSKGDKILSDEVLTELVKNFNKYTFTPDNFEFPDLLGAAYEFLIKYFAESAGKKGGEFYTPAPVVQLMGRILQPAENADVYDPTAGSGGLLINLKEYVTARYGTGENLSIFGQEVKEGTYKMCRMNMIFHGIRNADIRMQDTLIHPQHVKDGVLQKFDIVVANPPFSQNYTTKNMEFKERFTYWMSQKKQADFMFVQHMVSVLKDDGRMAVIMPHGVLFRGGREQEYRKDLITKGLLECIIGLPQGLFYGTGIPAAILVINKKDCGKRDSVLFINADREYREGKNQNSLRPEDVEKISYTYLNKIELPKYSKKVLRTELASEGYNCNIRRYVDNTPETPVQDVYAHLHGGIPSKEVALLDPYTSCYGRIAQSVFTTPKDGYCSFNEKITVRESIKPFLLECSGYKNTRKEYDDMTAAFWKKASTGIAGLPRTKDVYDLEKRLESLFSKDFAEKKNPVLDEYQSRGAFAQYLDDLKTDFKSIAASGWTAELIPDEELLRNQYPEVLEELEKDKTRRDDIQAQFDEIANLEDGEWDEDTYDIFPDDKYKEITGNISELSRKQKTYTKMVTTDDKRLKAYKKSGRAETDAEVNEILNEKVSAESMIAELQKQIDSESGRIAKHTALAEELKQLKKDINAIEKNKELLAAEARGKIKEGDAKTIILSIGYTKLHTTISGYLDAHIRALQQQIESLYDKYTVTLGIMLKERDKAVKQLNTYLKELGYEA